jgi:thioredoxin 1
MKNITAANWEESVLSQPLVLVDFWADWCAPCKKMSPILEQLESEVPELSVVKINSDENTDLALSMNITSIPTLMLYKNGELVWSKTGAKPKTVLLNEVLPFV